MTTPIYVQELPLFPLRSPKLVLALDEIRSALDENDDELAEFYWFAREFPRYYRYHLSNAQHRLKNIHAMYMKSVSSFVKRETRPYSFEVAVSDSIAYQIYWEFEAYLNALSSALDLMARIVGLSFKDHAPASFNKLCSKTELKGPVELLRSAKTQWVDHFKDYRDCFVHYVPIDERVFVVFENRDDVWSVRCPIPVNPNIRQVHLFRYTRRAELLRYSIKLYKNMMILDRRVAKMISGMYANSDYPKRTTALFSVGIRSRQ